MSREGAVETFYGLRWYLTFMQHIGTVLMWAGWLALLVLAPLYLLRRRRRVGAPDRRLLHMREYLAPLALMVLGTALLCLPGWRWLDGLLNEADIAVMGCVFQVHRGAGEPEHHRGAAPPVGHDGAAAANPLPAAEFVPPVTR